MSFLAPAFLIGLAAIALPVWLHRLRTQSSERKPFGSAMLLEASEERIHVRKKLKYLPLLALRIGLLALLALAFAKPYLEQDTAAGLAAEAGTHVVVMDTSASMQRDGVMDAARERAREALDAAPAGAVLQLVAGGNTLRVVTEPSSGPGPHRSAAARVAADTSRLDFGELVAAIDAFAAELQPPVTVHLVSDFQQSAMPARFADLGTRHVARLVPYPVTAGDSGNGRIDAVRELNGVVEVATAGAAGRQVVLQLNGNIVGRQRIPPGERQQVTFAGVEGIEGENRLEATLAGTDAFGLDDQRFAAFARGNARPVPVLTRDTGALPFVYISAALDAGGGSGFVAEPMPLGDFDPRVLTRYRFAIVDDIGAIDPSLEAPIRDWVERGGSLLAFAGSRTAGRANLPVAGHEIPPARLDAGTTAAVGVGRLNEKHPALAGTDGWFAPRFGAAIPFVPRDDDDVIVGLENDSALLVESRLGSGKILLVTAGLENVHNDLPIRPVFVGFLLEASRYLSGTAGIVREFGSGDRLRLPGSGGQVLDPDGEALLSLQGTTAAGSVRLGPPGIYTVLGPGLEYAVAVNVDARESRFDPVSGTVLDEWTALTAGAVTASGMTASQAEPGRFGLWHWALLALVLFIVAESAVGDWLLAPAARARKGVQQ